MIARGVDKSDLDYALELVITGARAREQGHQMPLLNALVEAGATSLSSFPNAALIRRSSRHWASGNTAKSSSNRTA